MKKTPLTNDKVYYLLSLAARARKLAFGSTAVLAALRRGKVQLIFLATDASENLARKIRHHAGDCPVVVYGTKDEFGELFFRRELGVIGVLDQHFANGMRSAIGKQTQRNESGRNRKRH